MWFCLKGRHRVSAGGATRSRLVSFLQCEGRSFVEDLLPSRCGKELREACSLAVRLVAFRGLRVRQELSERQELRALQGRQGLLERLALLLRADRRRIARICSVRHRSWLRTGGISSAS